MSDGVKSAIIIAIGIVAAVGLYLYFSPYQSCVRAFGPSAPAGYPEITCAKKSN